MKMKKFMEEMGDMMAKGLNIRADIVPMIDETDEDALLNDNITEEEMPVLPVMEQVLFPGVLLPFAATRPKARKLLEEHSRMGEHILVFTQLNDEDEPKKEDLFGVGVVAKVLKVIDFKKDITIALLQGVVRCAELRVSREEPYMMGSVTMEREDADGMDTPAFKRKIKKARAQYAEMMRMRTSDDELGTMVGSIGSDKIFINFVAAHLEVDMSVKYNMLLCDRYVTRLNKVMEQMVALRGLDELKKELDEKTRDIIGRQQREYFLRHQMDVIQEELGGQSDGQMFSSDMIELSERAKGKKWPKNVEEQFEKELTKLGKISPMSQDYTVQLNYLETLLDLPWNYVVDENYNLERAKDVMEINHYGIEKVKERIVEYLAVLKRQQSKGIERKAQVLCLVGPPGTGKTSICRSVAEAMDRPYRRVALGGLHDEAEIRGHRKTYVGAMPGRIIQEIMKAGASNPVFVLDEIDKVQSNNFNGDPSSALLEVLDPEQNCTFHDNYLGLDYDLSKVFFIATANNMSDIHPALLDRMEVIDFSGYVLEEKREIARLHLLPRLREDNGIQVRSLQMGNDVIEKIINEYTREGGVRQLEKQLAKIVRHRVVQMESGQKYKASVSEEEVRKVLGLPIHDSNKAQKKAREGVVTGLAWTPVGGEILFIESSLSRGKGTLSMTGNLGDVMKESATLAFEYLKSHCEMLGVDDKKIEESNIHIHVPEGATPKDGPSAGITMMMAMVSAFTHKKVKPNVAMTGEITLRGDVTPVGGIKEKILAAKRAGITDIIMCEENRRDVEDINKNYLNGLEFHYIENIMEAIPIAFEEGEV